MDPLQQPPAIPETVLDEIREVLLQTRVLVSVSCGVYVWEWCTNFWDEYRFIWQSRLSYLNITFLLLRYYTFVALGVITWVAFWQGDNEQQCRHMVLLLPYMPMVVFILSNIIVIARVYAMWDKDNRILALLGALYIAQVVVQGYVPHDLKPLHPPPGFKFCGPAFLGNAYLLYWVMLIVFDTTVLALSVFKLIQLWRTNGFASKIVRVLFRDQVVFYILTFAVNATNITVYYAARGPGGSGKDFMSPVTTCVTSMAICRVVLNLRRAAATEGSFSSSNKSRSRGKGSNSGNALLTPVTARFAPTRIPKEAFDNLAFDSDMEKQDVVVNGERFEHGESLRLQPVPKRPAATAVTSNRIGGTDA